MRLTVAVTTGVVVLSFSKALMIVFQFKVHGNILLILISFSCVYMYSIAYVIYSFSRQYNVTLYIE